MQFHRLCTRTEEMVYELIAFLSCAELSDLAPDFNYYDEQSKLEYIVELYPDVGELHDLTYVILSDPENINYVLSFSSFGTEANTLLDEWFEYGQTEDSYYHNLRRYACDYNDEYLLDLFRNYEEDYQAACEENGETFPYSPLPSPRGTPSPDAS
jgi:hypothetical protein